MFPNSRFRDILLKLTLCTPCGLKTDGCTLRILCPQKEGTCTNPLIEYSQQHNWWLSERSQFRSFDRLWWRMPKLIFYFWFFNIFKLLLTLDTYYYSKGTRRTYFTYKVCSLKRMWKTASIISSVLSSRFVITHNLLPLNPATAINHKYFKGLLFIISCQGVKNNIRSSLFKQWAVIHLSSTRLGKLWRTRLMFFIQNMNYYPLEDRYDPADIKVIASNSLPSHCTTNNLW